MNLNKVMLIGNVVRDPEMKTTPNGQNVTSYSVATNLVWKDQAGQRQEKVEFHNIVAWRKLAEITSQYLKKGSKVYVEGRLQTRSWDDPNGLKRYRTEIVAENMIMLDRQGQTGASSGPSDNNSPDYSQPEPSAYKSAPRNNNSTSNSAMEEEISVEDIPF